jgi:hypothetical protein
MIEAWEPVLVAGSWLLVRAWAATSCTDFAANNQQPGSNNQPAPVIAAALLAVAQRWPGRLPGMCGHQLPAVVAQSRRMRKPERPATVDLADVARRRAPPFPSRSASCLA